MPTPESAPGRAGFRLLSCILDCCAGPSNWPGWAKATEARSRRAASARDLVGQLGKLRPIVNRPTAASTTNRRRLSTAAQVANLPHMVRASLSHSSDRVTFAPLCLPPPRSEEHTSELQSPMYL